MTTQEKHLGKLEGKIALITGGNSGVHARFLTLEFHGTHWPLLDDVEALGLPFAVVGAFAATVTKLLGGLAVATGFLTRFAALAVASSLLVAAYSNFLVGKENQLALLYAVLLAGLTFYGGGRYSADAILFGSR